MERLTQQDLNRQKWHAHIAYLQALDHSAVNLTTLAEVQRSIRRCQYPSVSDAILQINSGFVHGHEYDLCLAWLLQNRMIFPSGFGVFRIDRQMLPQVPVDNPMADALTISERPPRPIVAESASGNRAVEKEPPPAQWDLF